MSVKKLEKYKYAFSIVIRSLIFYILFIDTYFNLYINTGGGNILLDKNYKANGG